MNTGAVFFSVKAVDGQFEQVSCKMVAMKILTSLMLKYGLRDISMWWN